MTIHEKLPSGFHFADRLQSEQYAATGSVNGASKVCLVRVMGNEPGYSEGRTELAVRLRPPFRPEHILSRPLIKIDLQHLQVDNVVDWYKRQYNAGWAAGRRGSGMDRSDTTHAWDDGYLDAAAGRPKWHLSWCLDHDECGEG